LDPADYEICGSVWEVVRENRIQNVDYIQEHIVEQQELVDQWQCVLHIAPFDIGTFDLVHA